MFGATFTLAMLMADTTNPIQAALTAYQQTPAYTLTLKSENRHGTEIIRYYFKQPGHVRMEFVTPHNGAVILYSPTTRRVTLWPLGQGRFPRLTLRPDNRLIQSPTGQRVDHSDMGALYRNVLALQAQGTTEILGRESINGADLLHLVVTGKAGYAIGLVARYQLWLNEATGFPSQVVSYGVDGKTLETVTLDGLIRDPAFPPGFFEP